MIISPHVFNDNTTTRSCAVWNRPCTAQAPEGRPRFPLSPPPAPNCVTPAVSTTRINSLPGPCGILRILHAAGPVRTVLDILAVSQHQFPRTPVVYHISRGAFAHREARRARFSQSRSNRRHATPTDRCRSAVGVVPLQTKCHDYSITGYSISSA